MDKEDVENKQIVINEDNEYIKISKNSRGYNFDFKIVSLDISLMNEVHNQIVSQINQWEAVDKINKSEVKK